MQYTIKTPQGFVKAIRTVGGELNEVTEYTNNRADAKTFTKKRLQELRARSYFRYYEISVVIEEITWLFD